MLTQLQLVSYEIQPYRDNFKFMFEHLMECRTE